MSERECEGLYSAKSFVGETMVVCVCFSIAVYVSDNMSVLGTDMCIEQF